MKITWQFLELEIASIGLHKCSLMKILLYSLQIKHWQYCTLSFKTWKQPQHVEFYIKACWTQNANKTHCAYSAFVHQLMNWDLASIVNQATVADTNKQHQTKVTMIFPGMRSFNGWITSTCTFHHDSTILYYHPLYNDALGKRETMYAKCSFPHWLSFNTFDSCKTCYSAQQS